MLPVFRPKLREQSNKQFGENNLKRILQQERLKMVNIQIDQEPASADLTNHLSHLFLILLKIYNNISINFSVGIIINTKITRCVKELWKKTQRMMLKISIQKVSASCSVTTSAWGLIPFFGRLMNKIRVSSFQTQYRENKKFEASWLCFSLSLWITAQESHKNTLSFAHWPNWGGVPPKLILTLS